MCRVGASEHAGRWAVVAVFQGNGEGVRIMTVGVPAAKRRSLVWWDAMITWLGVACTVLVGAAGSTPAEAPAETVAPAEEVSTEVVRIKRDFGKSWFDLAIDAWAEGAERLAKVQLRWVNTSEGDRRKPLGKLIERMVALKYTRVSKRSYTVTVAGDGKEFKFTVEMAKDGGLHTYVAVDSDAGVHVPRCRTDSAKLLARRVLGIPVGIAKVAVTCSDAGGATHAGQVRHRPV